MRVIIIAHQCEQISQAATIARSKGADVMLLPDIETAMGHIRSGKGCDLVMIDVALEVGNLVESLDKERINVNVVGCGVKSDAAKAAAAIKAGAKEYVPFPPDENMISAILEAISNDSSEEIICASSNMREVIAMADKVAASEANILITGESGTGKEVIARYLHSKSTRSKKRMVGVNCAAIPDNLLESELFGHEKGAFTGAIARRVGKFEEANGSTLFLDEISEMDIKLQAKLLRAIQEKEITRVGGSGTVKVDIRVVATSNRDLQKEVQNGNFRQDLFFRLNVIHLALPPLRHRSEEISIFTEFFIKKFCHLNHLDPKTITKEALSKLQHYQWPGNVRELENVIHRAVLMAQGDEIAAGDIILMGQEGSSSGVSSTDLVGRTVGAVEKELILNTLDHCLGNRTHAANILGISIRTLRNKLNEYSKELEPA